MSSSTCAFSASTGSSTSTSGTTSSTGVFLKLQHDGLALFLGKLFLHHCVAEECIHGSRAPTYRPAAELSGAQFEIAVGPNHV
ncbi:hypothetical protein E2C01_028481 [Portunus trituberculatus]|uniref:Uncharacterized protein n=1 Tax=Portunus trituberculatus TaxID=210409 RepID=A0A5B7EKJ6_PORTR|nr:hypothetical protein [Portunus trituberculatus]